MTKKISIDLPEDAVRNPEGYFADIKNACRAALREQRKLRVSITEIYQAKNIDGEDYTNFAPLTTFDLSWDQVQSCARDGWAYREQDGTVSLRAACREIVKGVDDE